MPTSDHFSNIAIAELLRNIAASYELRPVGGRDIFFRIIAYQKAADAVEHLSRELHDIWKEGKLQKVRGIGPGIGSALSEYFEKGESTHFQEVLKGIPPSVFTLMKVPGIGPKKAFRLVATFGLTDPETVVDDLRHVARADKISHLEGFGKKSQDAIIEGLDVYTRKDRRSERMPLPFASEIGEEVVTYMQKLDGMVKRIDILGSLRRRVATIGDIDIAVIADENHMQKVIDHFIAYPGMRKIEASGENKASILTAGNIRVDLRVQELASYGSMLQYFTGSKAHNIKLREYALKKGYSLSEYGMKVTQHASRNTRQENSIISFKEEESLYSFLGLSYIPPELREGTDEIERAKNRELPKLIEIKDIRGDIHMHTDYDLSPSHDKGLDSYASHVAKAQALGYTYIGFSEHNPKQKGFSKGEIVDIMKKRKTHIDTVMKHEAMPYFIGLEVDILPDGELALPESAFPYVDYLIVSLHSSFHLSTGDMTRRVLRALSHPKVKIFGHPTGRLLEKREGVTLHWEKIFEHVRTHHQALEINAGPSRLDLPDTLVREAKEFGGIHFVINTDAHAVAHMDWMKYGVDVARRGWLEKKDVVNTWSREKFEKWIRKTS